MAERTKARSVFVCQECGRESLRWQGRCPECQAWNSFVERSVRRVSPVRSLIDTHGSAPVEMAELQTGNIARVALDGSEFDRVLGGGAVPGSLILIGGDPGIG